MFELTIKGGFEVLRRSEVDELLAVIVWLCGVGKTSWTWQQNHAFAVVNFTKLVLDGVKHTRGAKQLNNWCPCDL